MQMDDGGCILGMQHGEAPFRTCALGFGLTQETWVMVPSQEGRIGASGRAGS